MVGFGSAPGKVILSGEHSVVYGYPALVAAIGLRCQAKIEEAKAGLQIDSKNIESSIFYSPEKLQNIRKGKQINPKFDNVAMGILQAANENPISFKLTISSDIPIGAGLGSSAAVSVASICAVMDHFNLEYTKSEISKKAYAAEKIAHGTPSGIDNTITTHGGYLRFEKGEIKIRQLPSEIPLVIINSKVHRNTKQLVDGVRQRKELYPEVMNQIFDVMSKLPDKMYNAIKDNDYETLGILFDINQGLLDSIGVGHEALSRIFWSSKENGALGTKLTGAGGGGCAICLVDQNEIETFFGGMKSNNIDLYQTSISPIGAIVGQSHE